MSDNLIASSIPRLERLSAIRPSLLYPHQADGVVFLLPKKRALLADGMGSAKPAKPLSRSKARRCRRRLPGRLPGLAQAQLEAGNMRAERERRTAMIPPPARYASQPGSSPGQALPAARGRMTRLFARYRMGSVVLDEAHFIKNASARTSHCLKLLGVQNEAKAPLIGTPMTNRPRDLFNLLRCVGHPAARSFLSFAKR